MKEKIQLTEKQVDDIIDFAFVITLCSFMLYAFVLTLNACVGG